MARLSSIPFEKVDPELQTVMREYDVELGGSGFVQVLAHAPGGLQSIHQILLFFSQHHARLGQHEIDGACPS